MIADKAAKDVQESESPIHVYRDGIPERLVSKLHQAKDYSVRQGARGKEYPYDMGVGGRVPSGALRLTRKAAEEDSNSNELSEKALGMAIDQIVQKALPDYNALGVVAISNIEIKGCFPTVHEGEGVIQGALTLNVSAKGYKYME